MIALTQLSSVCFSVSAGFNMFNVSLGWKNSRTDGPEQVCTIGGPAWSPVPPVAFIAKWLMWKVMMSLFFQLKSILHNGFKNKFYNVSMKSPGGGSSAGVEEYRVNVSSDTPDWYVRDYLARSSSHFNISTVEVDGKMLYFYLLSMSGWVKTCLKRFSIKETVPSHIKSRTSLLFHTSISCFMMNKWKYAQSDCCFSLNRSGRVHGRGGSVCPVCSVHQHVRRLQVCL